MRKLEAAFRYRLTFVVWAIAAAKPPAVPYLPQLGQTAVSEGSPGTRCVLVHDAFCTPR